MSDRTDAAKVRKAMLVNLRKVVRLCECDWPVTIYRNGHGHADECPAAKATLLGQRIMDKARTTAHKETAVRMGGDR